MDEYTVVYLLKEMANQLQIEMAKINHIKAYILFRPTLWRRYMHNK